MSGTPSGAAWLAGEHASFEEALAAGGDVRRAALAAGPRLPRKDLSRLYPSTMQDAVTVVHARLEENKKKAAASKQKSKSKAGGAAPLSPSDSHFPGARPGGGEPSAFWMYIEDYFRDFTQDDLRALLPLLLDPRDDPAYKVPACGRRVEDEHQQRKHAAAKAAAEAARAAAAASLGRTDWDAGAVDSRPSGVDAGSPDPERRSSRLVSRHCKEEEQRRQLELEAQALAAATAAEQAELAAAAAAARAMSVVPTTASGAVATQLLEVLPEQRLAMLLQQISALQQLLGMGPLAAGDADVAVQTSLATLLAADQSTPAQLDEAARVALQGWLQQRIASLGEQLGCSLPVLPPWAGQAAPARDAEAAEAQGAAAQADGTAAQQAQQAAAQEQRSFEAATAVAAAGPAGKVASASYIHAYTELMLRHRVQQHTVQQAVEVPAPDMLPGVLSRTATMGPHDAGAAGEAAAADCGDAEAAAAAGEAATPAASLLTATPGSAGLLTEVPSVANISSLSEQQPQPTATTAEQADGGATALDTAATSGAAGFASPATAPDGLGAAVAAAGAGADGASVDAAAAGTAGAEEPAGGPATAGGPPSRAGGRARAVSNYALLAGKKSSQRPSGPPKKVVRTVAAKPEAEAAAHHPVARAVQALVAAGEPDAPAANQWQSSVQPSIELLAAAPEDEVLAEMLALQNELMQQAAINRARLVPALAGVLGELEARLAAAEQRAQEEEAVKSWTLKMREIKRQQHRQRREQQHQEALAAKKQTILASPRPVLGRQRGAFQMEAEGSGGDDGCEGSPPLEYTLRPHELYDVLAQREADQESFCAVCGDGQSVEPNQIVFCERCDVAVHQQCYGIAVVPEDEWLCEPCREYEEMLRAQGVPEADIRPPGWQANPDSRRPLDGGARSVRCALCPIKYGAFKRAEDGRRWVHSACALWIPETFLSFRELPGVGRQEFVAGLEKVKPERLHGQCAICGLTDGAVMQCQQSGGCNTSFHVLCARNIGLYLTIRPDPARKAAVQYRIYCALHSAAQQAKDEKAWQERLEKQQQQQQKESKAKHAERLAAAKQQLVVWESERFAMHTLRANLETCRMLIDVTKRRERLKKQVAVLQQQEWAVLLQQDPAEAAALLQEWQQRRREQQEEDAAAAAAAAQQQAAMGPSLDSAGSLHPDLQQQQAVQQLGLHASLAPPQQVAAAAAVQHQAVQVAAAPPRLQPQQLGEALQQRHQQLQLPPAALAGLPMAASAGSMPLLPAQAMQQAVQQQLMQQQAQQAMMQQAVMQQAQQHPPPLLPLPAQAAPSFALDMFAQQAQPAPAPTHFFMQQPQQQPQQSQQVQQQQVQQQQAQQQQQVQVSTSAVAAAAFAGLPMPLNLGSGPAAAAGLQQPPQPQPQPQQPSIPAGMLNAPGSSAAAAQVPAEVAAAIFGVPNGAGVAPPLHIPAVDPAVAAMLRWQPIASHGAAAAAAGAAAGPDAGPSPQPPAGAATGAGGRPKRAAAAAAGASKRRRMGSEEAATPTAAGGSGLLSHQHSQQQASDTPTLGLTASGRQPRTAAVRMREDLLMRERQMTAEEAEALNAKLPGPLRYLPAAEVEASLGSPTARNATGRSGGGGQRQAKLRSKAGSK